MSSSMSVYRATYAHTNNSNDAQFRFRVAQQTGHMGDPWFISEIEAFAGSSRLDYENMSNVTRHIQVESILKGSALPAEPKKYK